MNIIETIKEVIIFVAPIFLMLAVYAIIVWCMHDTKKEDNPNVKSRGEIDEVSHI